MWRATRSGAAYRFLVLMRVHVWGLGPAEAVALIEAVDMRTDMCVGSV